MQVFFGGEPWMLQCANENVTIAEGFLGASKRLSVTSNVKFGAIDCNGKLPSNKTFWQRFGQIPKPFSAVAPVGFLFANNNDPLAIPEKYINNAKKLSEWAEKYRSPTVPHAQLHFFLNVVVPPPMAMMFNFTLLSLTSSEGLRTNLALTEPCYFFFCPILQL